MKTQNEMSTRITVDAIQATHSMSALNSYVRAVANSWKAEIAELRSAGKYQDAAIAKVEGLSRQIEAQKAKIDELKLRQEGLDTSTSKGTEQFARLEKQIASSSRQLGNLQAQQERARNSSRYYTSGLADLQQGLRRAQESSKAYADSLEANGNKVAADRERIRQLNSSLSNLQDQYKVQSRELNKIAESSGKSSEAYRKQKIYVDETSTSIGHARTDLQRLHIELAKEIPLTPWQRLRNSILGISREEAEATKRTRTLGEVFKGSFLGTAIGNAATAGLASITTGLQSVIRNGYEADRVAGAMEARWKNIGVNASGVKSLSNQVRELRTNTNLSADSVNNLQARFYGMTHSVSQTRTLTKGVASLTDELKLSDQQANSFATGLARIESAGKVTSGTFGRLQRQAPGLSTAMAKAAGMSQKSFNKLVSSGKMTSDQFNKILAKAARDYNKNAAAFDKSSGGALHRLQQNWQTTEMRLAKPLVKVSATGLNDLNKALSNKNTQRGLQVLAKGLAEAAVQAAKFIGYIGTHTKTVKTFGIVLASAFAVGKVVTGIARMSFYLEQLRKNTVLVTAAQRLLSLAVKASPWGIAITAIAAVVAALVHLYKTNKTFRNFVNGFAKDIAKFCKNVLGQVVKTIKTVAKNLGSFVKTAGKDLSNLGKRYSRWRKQQDKENQQYLKQRNRRWDKANQERSRSINKFNKQVARTVERYYRQQQRDDQRNSSILQRNSSRMMSSISRTTSRGLSNIGRWWSRHWNNVSKWAIDGWITLTKHANNGMDNIGKKVSDGLDSLSKNWKSTWDDITHSFSGVWSEIKKLAKDGMNGVIDIINDGIGAIDDVWKFFTGHSSGMHKISHMATGGIVGEVPVVVNDGPGPYWKELIRHTNGEWELPQQRNQHMMLERGARVFNGAETKAIMNHVGIQHYANGGVVGELGERFRAMLHFLEQPVVHIKNVIQSGVGNEYGRYLHFGELAKGEWHKMTDDMRQWVKKTINAFLDSFENKALSRDMMRAAAVKTRVEPSEGFFNLLWQTIMSESGGRSIVQQIHDVNSGGNEAAGILQYTPGTFAKYALPGHGNRFNPFDELLAFFNNTDWLNSIGQTVIRGASKIDWLHSGPQGGRRLRALPFANGGYVTSETLAHIAENNRPEYIIPTDINKRSRAYELLGEVVAQFRADDPHGNTMLVQHNYSKQLSKLESQFSALLNMMSQLLGLNSDQIKATQSISLDPNSLYRRQARDLAMHRYQKI